MQLIIEALLLILAALGQDHSAAAAAEGQIISLNMAPDSVDDQYVSCKYVMAHHVETKLLNNELNTTPGFKEAWEKGVKFAKIENDDLTKNHSIAIYVYSGDYLHVDFNRDTRIGKNQYKNKTFKWYSLHFLLTEAIRILNEAQNECYTTYRGTTVEFNKDVLNTEIRFGSFASSSLDPDTATNFGGISCFKIYTCEGADVTNYAMLSREREVLIPPYEKFNVTAVKTGGEHEDLKCKTVFTLESTGRVSNLECAVAFQL